MLKKYRFCIGLLLAAILSGSGYAACTSINVAPYIITQSGSYCLAADVTGYIDVQASHVNLDFQGHTLTGGVFYSGVPGPLSTDFTVHNGTVMASGGAALFGISIGGNYRNQPVTNITVDHMNVYNATNVGIAVIASSVVITNNNINATRNTAGYGIAAGIDVESIDISSSDVLSLPLQGARAGSRAVIQGNTVTNTVSQTPDGAIAAGTPQARGIGVHYYADILISGNTITNTYVLKQSAPNGVATGMLVDATGGFCGHANCTSAQLGGLVIENNSVSVGSRVLTTVAAHNSTAIKINHAPDHAIVVGSTISLMDTGIDANQASSWPGTPPVLLLDNSFSQVATPTIGGVSLPQ